MSFSNKIQSKIKVRVRYGETDQMGYVYHGNYTHYIEMGRLDWLNRLGFSYKEMEENGVMLPVYNLQLKYIKPAFYDDELTVVTILKEIPSVRIIFQYEIYNSKKELITTAETTLVFVDMKTRKPISCPQYILEKLKS